MTLEERYAELNRLIGMPWVANASGPDAWDCYHLTRYVQRKFWNREMPDIVVPNDPTWTYIIRTIEEHEERKNWREVPTIAGMPIRARDGALVGMAASTRPAHMGVWFSRDQAILHVDNPDGVMFQDIQTIKMMGWQKLRFYEPIN